MPIILMILQVTPINKVIAFDSVWITLNLALSLLISAECALMFLKEPKSPIYAVEGNDVDIEWFYSEVNKTTDLMAIIWRVQNKTTGNDLVLIVETVGGTPTVNPNIPAEYRNRVEIKDQATLVIKEVTSGDSTDFSCRLRSSQAAPLDAISRIQLVVIGNYCLPNYCSPGALESWPSCAIMFLSH